jgi:hypothetical protein
MKMHCENNIKFVKVLYKDFSVPELDEYLNLLAANTW